MHMRVCALSMYSTRRDRDRVYSSQRSLFNMSRINFHIILLMLNELTTHLPCTHTPARGGGFYAAMPPESRETVSFYVMYLQIFFIQIRQKI